VSGARRPVVTLLSLGGTIAMGAEHRPGVVPQLDATELAAAIGSAAGGVDLRARTVRRVPGASLRIDDIYALAGDIEAALDAESAGVVVSQGTDTMEETAFLLDLLIRRPTPVVLTGAMRNPATPGADGPANLGAAVLTAASGLDLRGVVVVMADEIHAAARVQKSHSASPAAITSDGGPLGFVSEGRVVLRSVPARRTPIVPRGDGQPSVPIITLGLGDDGRGLRAADGADGLVIAGFGGGHVPEWLVPDIAAVAARIPVLLVSRTRRGPVLRATYGFAGSELDLRGRGIATAGTLDPVKARILLIALLRAGLPADQIAARLAEADAAL